MSSLKTHFPLFLALGSACLLAQNIEKRQRDILENIKEPTPFQINYPAISGSPVNAADFGLSTGATPETNARALQQAINYCKANHSSKLILPKGTFHLRKTTVDSRDRGKPHNHYSNRIFTINLIGMEDFVLDGQGAELVFEELSLPPGKEILGGFFRVLNCRRVRLTDFTIDWNWSKMPLGFIGKIVKVDPGELTVDYRVSYNHKPIPEEFRVYAVRGWDPTIGNRTNNIFEFYWKTAESHKMIGPHTLRFTFKNKRQIRRARAGMHAIFKTKTHFFAAGIVADENEHTSIDNIAIHGTPSSAIQARRNKVFEIINCRVMPRPGTEKVWSSHSGFEVHNCLGQFRMQNNHLEFTHDDALHFSDYFLGGGFRRLAPQTLEIRGLMYWQAADAFIIGDTYEFRNRDHSPTGFKAKLKQFEWTFAKGTAKHSVTAIFDREIPPKIKTDALLFNISSYGKGQFHIRNNTIKTSLCHGLYIGMPNGIVENNKISSTAYPALLVHSVIRWTRWHIGHPPSNVIIRNNHIENANSALRPPADIFIGGGIDPQQEDYFPATYPVAQNILIEGNSISNSQWQPLAIWSAKNVIVRHNTLTNPNRLPSKKRYAGTIHLNKVKNIIFTGNRCQDDGQARDHGIKLHPGSCEDVFLRNNPGLE